MLLLTILLVFVVIVSGAPQAIQDETSYSVGDVSNVDTSNSLPGQEHKTLTVVLSVTAGVAMVMIMLCSWIMCRRIRKAKAAEQGAPTDGNATEVEDVQTEQAQTTTAQTNRSRNRREVIRRSDSGESLKTLPEYQASLGEGELRLSKPVEVAMSAPQRSSVSFPTPHTTEAHRRTADATETSEGQMEFEFEIGSDAQQDPEVPNDQTAILDGHRSLPVRCSHQISIDSYHTVGTTDISTADHREEISHAHNHDSNDDHSHPSDSPRSVLSSSHSAMSFIPTLPSKIMNSFGRRRPGSSHSGHQRNISAPLSITHLRVEEPASGFSVQQVAFLSSVESLGRYGVALSQGRHLVGTDDPSPPPFETDLDLERQIPLTPLRHAPLLTAAERQARSEQAARELGST